MNSQTMKAEVAAYWRFVRQMPLVAVEAMDEDVLIVNKRGLRIITEIKISISDLRRDALKQVHADIRTVLGLSLLPKQRPPLMPYHDPNKSQYLPHAFYFAVPNDLIEKTRAVVEEKYPYAGLLKVSEAYGFRGRRVDVVKVAQVIHKRKLSPYTLARHVMAQSASLANAYDTIACFIKNQTSLTLPSVTATSELDNAPDLCARS